MTSQRNAVRIEQTRQELQQLQAEVKRWLARRRTGDRRGQYDTQLRSLELVVHAGLAAVEEDVERTGEETDVGRVYDRCRRNEERTVLVRRLWQHFRDRWDQRDGDRSAVLAAADEVVWSCFATACDNAGEPRRAAPLPFVDAWYSARASQGVRAPADLRARRDDALLAETLAALPLPLILLPPLCAQRPWWLVVAAHETGHQVQYGLADGTLRADTAKLLPEVAATACGGAADAGWRRWHDEVFADAFAALAIGPAAVWAIAELELGDGATMAHDDNGAYPPRAVRLALMTAVLETAGLPRDRWHVPVVLPPPVGELADADRRRLEHLMQAVPAVARALVEMPVGGASSLVALCSFEADAFARDGHADWWRKQLLAEAQPSPEETQDAARMAIAGAVAAWAEVAEEPEAGSRARRGAALAARILTVVPHCHLQEATRAAPADRPAAEEVARRFAASLLDRTEDAACA